MKTAVPEQTKICIKCGDEKDITQFEYRNDTQKYRGACIECNIKQAEIRRRKLHPRIRRVGLAKDKAEYNKEYYATNNETIRGQQKEYRIKNKATIRKYNNELERNKRRSDPVFRLRKDFSRTIQNALKESGGSKRGKSMMDYLPYSIIELKVYLEKQFEPWMTWNNHGFYIAQKYSERDVSTWTWHIDHIVPQSKLLYVSMTDENFRKCWALENLRPLKSIDNLKKGSKITS